MELTGIDEACRLAHQRWGIEFVPKNTHEAHGPCPICGKADDDGFIVFEQGYYLCRPGGCSGWLDENDRQQLTPEQRAIRQLQAESARQARQIREHEKRLSALEQMHRCADHLTYHRALDTRDRDYWHSQGMTDATIDRYLLGVCYACPTDKEHRPSWTIPVVNGGKLVNIRHRLIEAPKGDKYRPHLAGLGNTLFNADHLYTGADTVLVCEGEKKSIVTTQEGFPSVGLMGMTSFPPAWAVRFESFSTVHVALDPDAQVEAVKVAGLFGGRGQVVTLPCKADDFFVEGGTAREFAEFLRLARRVD